MTVPGFLKRLLHIKLGVIVALVVLIALLVSAGRVLMATLPDYKGDIEDWLSAGDFQVRITSLNGEWHNLWPALNARGVSLQSNSGDAVFELAGLEVELDMLGSLWQQAPVFRRVVLDRLDLHVLRQQDGGWRLQGTAPTAATESAGTDVGVIIAQLLRQQQIRFDNATVTVALEGGRSYPPQVINAGYLRQNDGYSLQLRLERSKGEAPEIRIRAQGVPGSDDFSARFYARLPQADRRFWGQFLAAEFPQLQQLVATSTLWGSWQGRQLQQLSGNLAVSELSWESAESVRQPTLLQDFSTELLLQRQSQGWHFQLGSVQGSLQQQSLPFAALVGSVADDGKLRLSADRLDLKSANAIMLALPQLPAAVADELKILQPEGMLRHPDFVLQPGHDEEAPRFSLQADLDRVNVSAWNGAPEIHGVKGLLRVDQSGGRVDFDSQQFWLNFPELYSQGWMMERARGVVSWELGSEGVQVGSELLNVWQQGVEGNGRFSLDMPFAEDQQSHFALMIGMDNSNGALAPRFVPDKQVDKGLFDWLSAALVAGQLNSGGFVFAGPLESWAPDPSVQMYFDVSGGTLRYQPDWPAISESESFTLIKGSEVLVDIAAGRIYNTRVNSGQVYLPPDSSLLSVRAELQGPAADARRVLLESPVKEFLGEEFSQWQLLGKAATSLDLGINLSHPDKSRIRVSSSLSGASYRSEKLNLAFEQLQGRIRYHEKKGLSAVSLKGRFFDQPVSAAIATEQRGDGAHTLISASGRMSIDRINGWLKQPILDLFSGTSDYQATLDICASRPDCSRLSVQSSLRGVSSSDIPPPYRKTALQQLPLTVRSNLGGDRQWLRVRYGNELHLLLSLTDKGLSGGELVAGRGQPEPQPRTRGLRIRGQLPTVDPLAWQRFLGRLFPDSVSDGGRLQIDPLLERVELQTAQLQFGEQQFQDVSASLQPAAGGWQLDISAPVLKGRLMLPPRGPFVADLAYLHLPEDKSSDAAVTAVAVDPLADFDPATLPPLHVSVADFRIGKEDYGRWRLHLDPVRDGVHITGIEGLIRKINSSADLWWLRSGGGHRTRMDLSLKADQLGDVNEAWNNQRAIEGQDARINGNLGWDGSPLNFNAASLDGDLSVSVGKGRFLDAGNAGDALKLLGLLNFKALGRRLRLDFSDLYKEGLSFDSITARYALSDGEGRSLEPLKLKGPSADLEMQGSFNLVSETLDQRMSVTLPLAENVSLTALLLSAPQVAGAAFLIEKLVGKQLRKFTTSSYQVSGSWDDPVIDAVRAGQNVSSDKSSER